MPTSTRTTNTEAAIWARVIHPEGELSPRTARAILRLSFLEADHKRMQELSAKARDGDLSSSEEYETDNYERVGHLLSMLKSKARKALKKTSSRQ